MAIDYSTLDQAPGQYINRRGAVDPGDGYNNHTAYLRQGFGNPGDFVQFGENIFVVGDDRKLLNIRTNRSGIITQRGGNITAHDPRDYSEVGSSSSNAPNTAFPTSDSAKAAAAAATAATGSATGFKSIYDPTRYSTVNAPTLANGAPNPDYNALQPTQYKIADLGPTGIKAKTVPIALPYAPEGVYSTTRGESLIVTNGPKPRNAGELIGRLQGKRFAPVQSGDSPGSPLYGKQVGIVTPQPRSDFTGGQGTISAAPEKTLSIFGFDTGFKPKTYGSDYYNQQATRYRDSNYALSGAYEFTAFTTGVFEGASAPILNTVDFFKGVKNTFVHPIQTGKDLIAQFGTNPAGTTGQFAGGLLFLKGAGKVASAGYRAGEAGVTRLSPNYVPATAVEGSDSLLIKGVKTSKGPVDINVVGGIGSESLATESLRVQAQRAGTTVNAVSGARNLFSVFKNEIKIDKPLPTPEASPLERSFFYDPEARLRPSRLGLTQTTNSASLSDVFSGNFNIFPERPQAILTPGLKVEAFPGYLGGIEDKLLSNKRLSPGEEASLLRFQLKPSGQAKPVGFLSGEPEVTLAPGETIRRVKGQGGVTLLKREGYIIPKRVPIIEAEVVGTGEQIAEMTTRRPLRYSLSSDLGIKPYLSPERPLKPFVAADASYAVRGNGSSDFMGLSRNSRVTYLNQRSPFGGSSYNFGSDFNFQSPIRAGSPSRGGSSPFGGSSPSRGGSPTGGSPFPTGGSSPFGGSNPFGGPSPEVPLISIPKYKPEKKYGSPNFLDVRFANKYSPSIAGEFLNIKGTRRQANIATITGLGIRPVKVV
jgi:hypothetical protein